MLLYALYILLGFLPSLIWLGFYLRKDQHPEPKSMVIKIFIWGMMLAPLAIIFEVILIWLMNPRQNIFDIIINPSPATFLQAAIAATIIPAVVEEYLKYSVVRAKILKNKEFDEPLDAMLYCVIAGLGFAAIENLLILLRTPILPFGDALKIIALRSIGATLVHALASGMVGYWLARAIFYNKNKRLFVLIGLLIAILFHTCYNYLVINASYSASYLFIISLIIFLMVAMAVIISKLFAQLKKQRGVCKI